eukprot:GEMP01033887.1.p1 GENE.GEMP01033887.1~~GEMP01033887.1.p1  ORF type:complete len:504 (+),score=99.49 GEMP01033887.1:31-1542(+)
MFTQTLNQALFPAPEPTYHSRSYPGQLLLIPQVKGIDELSHEIAHDEPKIPCVLITFPSARYLIVFLHGNAEDIGTCYEFCRVLRDQFQCHLLAVEYPGYGQCRGVTTEHSLARNAFAAMHFALSELMWQLDSIKIMGRSIGSAPALRVSSYYKCAGLILVAPFLSMRHVIYDLLGPVSWLVEKDSFSNGKLMARVKSPVLIVHGKMDMLISSRQSEKLYDICRTRKLLVLPREMDHNTNLLQHVGYFVLPMLQFFQLPDYSYEDMRIPNWAFVEQPTNMMLFSSLGALEDEIPLDPVACVAPLYNSGTSCRHSTSGRHVRVTSGTATNSQSHAKEIMKKEKTLQASSKGPTPWHDLVKKQEETGTNGTASPNKVLECLMRTIPNPSEAAVPNGDGCGMEDRGVSRGYEGDRSHDEDRGHDKDRGQDQDVKEPHVPSADHGDGWGKSMQLARGMRGDVDAGKAKSADKYSTIYLPNMTTTDTAPPRAAPGATAKKNGLTKWFL